MLQQPPLATLPWTAPKLLLASIAGTTAAVGITVARWLLLETGEVLVLLFANTDTNTNTNIYTNTNNNASGEGGDEYDEYYDNYDNTNGHRRRQNAATLFDDETEFYNDNASETYTFGTTTTTTTTCSSSATCSSTSESNDDPYSSSSSFAIATVGEAVGETLRAIGTSPIVRSSSLILLFLSSVALLAGVILIRGRVRDARRYGEECVERCAQRFLPSDASSSSSSSSSSSNSADELTTRIKEKRMQLRTALRTKFVTAVNYTEGMVLDDVLRTAVKNGNEFAMGIMGGMVLYSLPLDGLFGEDDGFGDGNNDGEEGAAKNARRRLIRAADPYLERILFRKGGVWDVLPPGVKERLAGLTMQTKAITASSEASKLLDHGGGTRGGNDVSSSSTEIALVDHDTNNHGSGGSITPEPTISDEDNDEEGSDRSEHTPLLASPTRDFDDTKDTIMHGVDVDDDDDEDAAVVRVSTDDGQVGPQVVVAVRATKGVREKNFVTTQRNNRIDEDDSTSPCGETMADALRDTIGELLVSNFIRGRTKSSIMEHDTKSERQSTATEELRQRQRQQHPPSSPPNPNPPLTPALQFIEKMLHRTSLTTAFLFLIHLRGSPSARKSWNSAAHFGASAGLLSAALGAGVVSAALHSNSNALGGRMGMTAMEASHRNHHPHPIASVVCAKALEGLHTNISLPRPMYAAWMMMLSSSSKGYWGSGIPPLQHLMDRLRREIRRNKRLQAALAFVVLSGVGRRMSGRDGGGGVVRRGIR